MNKTQRLIQLMMAVNERMAFTTKELAQEFGVSERTMHRDLQELSELGMPLYTEFGPHGGYRLLKKRMLPPILFTEQEAVAMFFAFQTLQYYGALPFAAESTSALGKFYHYLPTDTKKRIDALKNRVSFWTPTRTQSSPYLEQLLEASIDGLPLHITYASKDGATERTIQPIGIYSSNGYWYFPSYCFQKDRILLFRTDRLQSLAPAEPDHPSKDLRNFTILDWLTDGVSQKNDSSEHIRLRVKLTPAGVRAYERSNGRDEDVTIHADGSGELVSEMHQSNLLYFSKYFLSMGADAVVEEPPEMVRWIREQLQRMLHAYSTMEDSQT
ncbi:YafY family transcriptional regulator [Paenibacillus sp. CGMCC 1.16610]|uniref:WYL domain-containing protein n=1 Tax=Paenibacillus anseongense TaxID=2682845 RepID=A0ABW9UHC4_9BACL|nr:MULTISPECIES: YafY family protein [Paenibacillus]MBA2939921.1 YafY family transcriptional regulator [Paenibacillus sp. CGMCC 1.16610]MVQ38876.1 WYL domain-containing protein [Paenibacillus anseongense]